MKYQEKKYRVDSFTKIWRILEEAGAKKKSKVLSTHYYAQQEGNNIIKLVQYENKNEIHLLQESQGKYSLKEKIPVETTDAGLKRLKDEGYKAVEVVKMVNTDYEYKGGIVGLYLINNFLHSVILDFPEGHHETLEKEFGLETAEVISVPYNKYLEQIGKLQSIKLK
ncbi:MAG: hypothetical protein WD231_00510 [Candidatus Woykebacteria bacterium]